MRLVRPAPTGNEETVYLVAVRPGLKIISLHHLPAALGEEVSRRFQGPILMAPEEIFRNLFIFLGKNRAGSVDQNPPFPHKERGPLQQLFLQL